MSFLSEEIKSRDIFAIVGVFILLIGLVIPPNAPKENAAVFVAKPPVGNITEAVETLLSTPSVAVTIYLIHKWPWYLFLQTLGIGEYWLLYLKIRTIRPGSSWSYSSVLDHGGSSLGNTEFWIYMFFHHTLLFIFAMNTASLFGVISLVVAYVLSLALICEPNDDCGRASSQQELFTNRVVLITFSVILTLFLFSRDEQIHGHGVNTDDGVWTIFSVQIALDGALLFAHCSANAQLLIAYVARLMYVVACNCVVFIWFVM